MKRHLREPLVIVLLYLAALVCVARAQQPAPRAYLAPPPQPVVTQAGTYYPVRRPCWLGQWAFGPVWVLMPNQQPQQQLPPPR